MNFIKLFWVFALINLSSCSGGSQLISTEKFEGNETLTYEECIDAYSNLVEYGRAELIEFGKTDVGEPLHLFLISSSDFDTEKGIDDDKVTFLINNAIHPGEPCGVDASVMFVKTILSNKNLNQILDHINIGIIPMYNIGGGLNRGCCSRANQNGPKYFGFRGNARNLDLNRDFIKCDSENAKSFSKIYQFLNPHVFLDTHTSNGADYQYVMTLITTQPDKATPIIGSFLKNKMVDELYHRMDSVGYPMAPYVYTMGQTPDDGIKDYLETPRYSTGYSTLFNSLGFVSETHMLKPYHERVQSTYELILHLTNFTIENRKEIIENKRKADKYVSALKTFEINWELDTTRFDFFNFLGYEAKYRKSEFSDNMRLYYDQDAPYEKDIRYYNRFLATDRTKAPEYYIVPQAWKETVERLRLNKVEMNELKKDTILQVEYYFITDLETKDNPYEGHYLHSEVKVEEKMMDQQFRAGDFLVPVNQIRNRYIVETLEPQAADAFFSWNFYDEVLQQKEWFSTYVFEDKAAKMLEEDEKLRAEFEAKQADSEDFRNNQWAQLYWLYKRSDNFESTAYRYPIARYNPKN